MKTPDLLDAKRKSSLLNSLGNEQIRSLFSKNILHIKVLKTAKPYPHFQKLPPEGIKKKPLSWRGNHALIAASLNFYKRIENFFLMTHNITDSVLQLSL